LIQDTAALDSIVAQIAFWSEFFSKLLILPSAFSALAFEHVNEIAAQRIHNHSDNCEFLAATAGHVGLILDNSNLLGAKYPHGRHGRLQPSAMA